MKRARKGVIIFNTIEYGVTTSKQSNDAWFFVGKNEAIGFPMGILIQNIFTGGKEIDF